ncbi:MAG: YciI family protein [Actinophytocola sp.]|uniref:YciI family protein n=1 Tax=Actinophytocola sp. TaxID=1872138 RepID=UPI003D6A57B4
MKYLMLAYTNAQAWQSAMADFDPDAPMPADAQAACDFYEQLAKELTESGEFVTTEGLADPTHTKTIRKRAEGGPEVTDGPYAEIKEVLASYAIIDCESYDRAVAIGARVADAVGDTIEIRPIMDAFGAPEL